MTNSNLRIRASQLDALGASRKGALEQRITAGLAELAAKSSHPFSHSRLVAAAGFAATRAPEFGLLSERDYFLFACLVLMAALDGPPAEQNRWVWQALHTPGLSGSVKLQRIYADARIAHLQPAIGLQHE
ncbi:MAG: hypothetical protein JNM66_04585 [Bryobacterales bacterium]|nr:hypothetical protein [Bryobacterales bacterium]